MYNWLINYYEEWKFQKKKKELIKLDPFIYELPDSTKADK
jgi:hypothetical protein